MRPVCRVAELGSFDDANDTHQFDSPDAGIAERLRNGLGFVGQTATTRDGRHTDRLAALGSRIRLSCVSCLSW
jgi:hypothetical protein